MELNLKNGEIENGNEEERELDKAIIINGKPVIHLERWTEDEIEILRE